LKGKNPFGSAFYALFKAAGARFAAFCGSKKIFLKFVEKE